MASPPPIQRQMMAAELRRLREEAFLTGEDIKARLGWSVSKISRIENARIGISEDDLEALLDLYRATETVRQRLLSLLRRTPTQPWWRVAAMSDNNEFGHYLDFEAVADLIEEWEIRVAPGLLQTESYARTLLQAWKAIDRSLTPRQVDERVTLRMRRQERITAEDAPRLVFVVDESVLMRRIGDASVMHGQLGRLLEVSELPNLTLHVLPLDAEREMIDGSFTLITLSPGEPVEQRLVYFDNVGGGLVGRDEAILHEYRCAFDDLVRCALTPELSRDLIVRHRTRWTF
ncbi:helix-turn-helix domain-containing protein [[Actinomadura] parvosata]|uniref:helix-turn-helix domain-containing protein n=1 Tax=[Actinomadura] parvosata TaxID=1955412 RepID=UPI00406C451F